MVRSTSSARSDTSTIWTSQSTGSSSARVFGPTIDAALGEMPAESETDRARRAIARQLRRWESLEPPERKRKIHAFLAQRGFGYDVIDEVIARPEAEASID